MLTYILKHEFKSEYVNNIKNFKIQKSDIHYWKIFENNISQDNLNLLYKYIQKKYNNEEYVLIIYDNCIINFDLLNNILNTYNTVCGKYNNDIFFIKAKIKDLFNLKINYIYNIDGKL